MSAMHSLKAHVRNGRLVLDEPTDLPEGEVVELVLRDDILGAVEEHEGPLPPWMVEELDRREREDAGSEQDGDVVVDRLLASRFGALRRITTIVDASDELLSAEDGWAVE